MRTFFLYLLLLVTVFWLVLSYIPAAFISLPQIPEANGQLRQLYGFVLAAGVGIMLLIQSWLVVATVRIVRKAQQRQSSGTRIRLTMPLEVIWTAFPLIATVILILIYI